MHYVLLRWDLQPEQFTRSLGEMPTELFAFCSACVVMRRRFRRENTQTNHDLPKLTEILCHCRAETVNGVLL